MVALDWSEFDPSIFGTLFERGFDPDKRSQFGEHYTDSDKIVQIVEPAVIQPILDKWQSVKANLVDILKHSRRLSKRALADNNFEDSSSSFGATAKRLKLRKNKLKRLKNQAEDLRQQAQGTLNSFLEKLENFTVLDPACGSGNFLYVSMLMLKDLEHKIQIEAEELGLQRPFYKVGPANVKGIEINPYAAELARVSVWIGHLQWMRNNGFNGAVEPVLEPLDNIECRDAIISPEGNEPDWPNANVIVGNPPFLGGKRLRRVLGLLRLVYQNTDYMYGLILVYARTMR